MSSAASENVSPQTLAQLQVLLDRQQILDCLTRIGRGIDRLDRELFVSAFHSDAVCKAGDFVGRPSQIYEYGVKAHEGQSTTQHNILNHTCEIDGDTAHAETYFLFAGRNHDETNWIAGGRYIDRFERRDGQWKIAVRCTFVEWSGVMAGQQIPLDSLLRRGRDDISYRRPLRLELPHG